MSKFNNRSSAVKTNTHPANQKPACRDCTLVHMRLLSFGQFDDYTLRRSLNYDDGIFESRWLVPNTQLV